MKKIYSLLLASVFLTDAFAQSVPAVLDNGVPAARTALLTLDECMAYAVANSTRVKQQSLRSDNLRQDRNEALASMFPTLGAGVTGYSNYGRSIDPETNAYTNTNNLSNSYSISSQMPLFTGLSRINTYRAARVGVMLGGEQLQQVKDEVALETMQAYFDMVYYTKTTELAAKQMDASTENYRKVLKQEELGLKSEVDVLQLETQMASDDYTLTRQTNLRDQAMIILKEKMNYPVHQDLAIDTEFKDDHISDPLLNDVTSLSISIHPRMKAAQLKLESSELTLRAARGGLWVHPQFPVFKY